MAYIDLDEINRLHPKLTAKYPLSFANGISAAINEINRLPTADVVPKSEGWTFENSPFEMLDMAFKRLFPDVKYTAYFEPNIRDDPDGEKVCGLTDFADNGEITIFIDTDLSINDSVEIFAHELAHAGVGVDHGHDKAWEKAFDDLFDKYNKIGEEMFSSNINAPKGEDYSAAIAKLKQTYIEQCPDCKHFVGCEEAVWSGRCDQYEKKHTEETK